MYRGDAEPLRVVLWWFNFLYQDLLQEMRWKVEENTAEVKCLIRFETTIMESRRTNLLRKYWKLPISITGPGEVLARVQLGAETLLDYRSPGGWHYSSESWPCRCALMPTRPRTSSTVGWSWAIWFVDETPGSQGHLGTVFCFWCKKSCHHTSSPLHGSLKCFSHYSVEEPYFH